MMLSIVTCALISSAFATCEDLIPETEPQCVLPEEIWQECTGHCEESCDYVINPKVCNCTCVPGCVCREGLKRRHDGACVTSDACYKCPENEVWDLCPKRCPRDSCAQLNPEFHCPLLPLIPLPCRPDCVCRKGYLRNEQGQCVPRNKCPRNQTCGVNEEIPYCKQSCPPKTCAALLLKDISCEPTSGCLPGCDCISEHVRDQYGQCIRKEECAEAKCGVNEFYDYCGSYCRDTCATRFLPPRGCPAVCKEGCDCKVGYFRHDNGTCVPASECSPSQCTNNAYYTKCGTACPLTCENIDKPQNICIEVCTEGCFCDPGLVKNEFGQCIKPQACKCDLVREEWSDCDANCERTCDNYKNPDRPCPAECVSGCICNQFYIRNKEGKCVISCD